MPVGNTGKIHVDGHKLVFEDPEQIDSGNYTVIISNMAGEKTKKVWIIMSGSHRLIVCLDLCFKI